MPCSCGACGKRCGRNKQCSNGVCCAASSRKGPEGSTSKEGGREGVNGTKELLAHLSHKSGFTCHLAKAATHDVPCTPSLSSFAAGLVGCNGKCVNIYGTDKEACGACGKKCAGNEYCKFGVCKQARITMAAIHGQHSALQPPLLGYVFASGRSRTCLIGLEMILSAHGLLMACRWTYAQL